MYPTKRPCEVDQRPDGVSPRDRVSPSPDSRSCRWPAPTAPPTPAARGRPVRELGRRVGLAERSRSKIFRRFCGSRSCLPRPRAFDRGLDDRAAFFSASGSCFAFERLRRQALGAFPALAFVPATRASRSARARIRRDWPRSRRHRPRATISMQSTGAGRKAHVGHPEQSSVTTVCISFGAPTMASTGRPGCTKCIQCSAPRRSARRGAAARSRSGIEGRASRRGAPPARG